MKYYVDRSDVLHLAKEITVPMIRIITWYRWKKRRPVWVDTHETIDP